jgi:N-acetylglutamate synthase/N-acetylornithine aminotransferase
VAADHDPLAVSAHLQGLRVEVEADLGLGSGAARIVTRDLSAAYIAENERTS